jgi:thiol-disulfide isomerase/thioredoxin
VRPAAQGIRLPELPAMQWLNSTPLSAEDFAGRALLVDFWDYSSVHCLRTLPYLKSWHERYRDRGLIVVGVHSPEFPFAREAGNVERAVARLSVPYAVALDSEFHTWQAFQNRYWPARYLFDAAAALRYYHFGEGDYEPCEYAIQECLSEIHPGSAWPVPLPPLRPEDRPGTECLGATPELYLGLERGRLGNAERAAAAEIVRFLLPGRREPDRVYALGPWRTELKHLESVGTEPAAMHLRYTAVEVNLVMASADGPAVEVEIAVDGEALPADRRGEDVSQAASGTTLVRVAEPRMYRLVRDREHGTHDLRLAVEAPGLRAYAFTFVSCVAPDAGTLGATDDDSPPGASTR